MYLMGTYDMDWVSPSWGCYDNKRHLAYHFLFQSKEIMHHFSFFQNQNTVHILNMTLLTGQVQFSRGQGSSGSPDSVLHLEQTQLAYAHISFQGREDTAGSMRSPGNCNERSRLPVTPNRKTSRRSFPENMGVWRFNLSASTRHVFFSDASRLNGLKT